MKLLSKGLKKYLYLIESLPNLIQSNHLLLK
jgi:hypothetical protein